MQDKKLLGDELSPKSTINASTDMSQSAFLPKGFQFEAPKAPQRNYDVTLGDTAKAVGSGALRSLAGLGELSENFLGVGEGFRDLMSSGSDSLQESMTQDGRDALNSRIFEENENGNPTFAEGAADIDVWAMKIADGLGSLAANFAGGGFAGAGAKVALRSTITKSMLKKGMTEKAAQAVADKAISRMAATGAGATGVGTSLGGASMDARDAVMQMDSSWLADNSDYFQQSLLRLADDPQYQGMSATELFDLAKEETASYASLQMSADPTAVAASVAGAMGDKYLFGALLGKMGKKGVVAGAAKGAITEGGTEFIEGYGQTYARNQITNEVTGQEIDPTTGALVDGLEGAVIGGALGGPLGAVGGYRAKGQPTENTPAQTNPQNVSDTQEQEIAEQAAEDAQAMPNNGDVPAQTAAMNAVDPTLNPQGQYDELLQGAQQRQADNGRDAAIRARFAQSRQALTERGVLPERNAYQETIEMARAVDPTRAAEIEQFLKSEEADQNPELTAQLEREYESLAQKGRDLDIDPTLTQIEHRQNQNSLDMAKREKPHQRIERKQNEYQLDDTLSSRKAAIRAEMEPQLLKEDRNKPELLESMVELEYARRYPQPEKAKAIGDQDNGLARFKSARFDRDTAQAAIEAKAQESKNAAQLAAAQRERDSRPASPGENRAWFGVHPESGERTTRAFMRDLANQKGQAQASERQIDLDARRERLGQPVSSFMDRPNSMKMREQGKKPIRDFAGIAGKTSRMSKRLRKRLSRAKGFDSDAVLAEFQNHEKRLAAYEEAARRRADYEANLPENIERRKNAEALFKEFVSDTEARTFAENEITQTIKRINALVDASPQGSVLELDGQTSSLPVIKKQMAHSVRNLANQFVGKTAAMMNAAALKKEASTQSVGSLDEPDIIQQAKAVIREVIDNNGGYKPKLKGVREAYRDKGFTAKALQEALGDKSLADFEREQKERYTERLSALSEPSIHSGQEVPLQSKGDIDHGNETSNTARLDERSSPQSEVQENEQRGTDANRSSVSEEDASAGRRANESRRTLPDSTERSVSRDAIERLALDEVDNLANGTATQRIAANIAAIRLMKDLTQSGMPATLEQKKVLAQYVGWGGLASVFDNTNTSKSQQAAHQELKTLLTEEEYNNVRMSTRNAFYTSEAVVKGMWSGVKALGLGNSPMNVVEPSLGSGNFIGWQPSDMRDQSRWFASELDPVTGNIAKLIYPEADVQVKGFQETPFKNGVFSLAIGNPPFGSQSIRDNKNPDISGMAIHNYFIAKSSKLLHENGLLMMVVTNRFLDTLNKNHKQLSQELDFVGAVRLPNTAFKSNAGTEVTTDIVVFRKLKQGETAKNTVWTDVDGEVNGFRVNQWFAQNPQYILGEVAQGKMYRGDESESTVNPVPQHANLEQSISKALASLAQGQDLALTPETKDVIAGEVMLAESDLAIGGMMVNADGKVMRRGDDHPTKGAQVYEVTPDSIWSDDGWLMSRARHFVEQGDKARLQQFADNEFLNKGKIKSDFTGSKLKESAVKAVLAYLTGQQSKNQALSALDDAIDNTRLGPNKFRKLKAMLTIRNSALALLRAEKTGAGDIERLRQRLNVQYDEFAKAFATKGKNSKPATLTESLNLLDGDTGIEAGLDSVSESGEVTKSDLFSKRLLFPYKRPESASNVSDAVNYSMRERGKVDIEYVSGLLGLGHDEVLAKLTEGEKPYLLMNPETQKYEFIDDYLSGNVKAKYQAAKSAGLDTNVKLLEAVLPEDKTPEQVKPSIRATWIDSDVFERFAEALGYKAKVNVNRHIGAISVLGEAGGTLSALGSQFKHDRATLADLLNSAANGKSLVIYDTNGKERTKNEKATKEVNALANKLASTFVTWAKSDAQIAKQIADNFNERINTHVNRKYNGRLYLQTVGMNPAVDMRKTQLDGALRMIQSKNTLLDHTVGAGKTFTAITGMMERKRLGLSKKPMAVVPNHILGSFHKDILKLYPSAKVLVADDKAFTAKKRKQFFSRIATGDYDVVLMGHSHLRALPNDIEHFRTVINEKIDELRSALEEAKAEAKQSGQRGATVKQIEDSISRLQDKIKEKEEALSKNADQIGFSFGDLGVDYLVVDEAHEFKNLTYATRTDRVVGMNDPKGSEKALDLLIKTRSIQGLENGGVTFMTGTPISNSLVEVYTMMYYLGHDTLKELKMSFYDAFAGSFFNTEITLEYTPTGTVKERSVLKGLNNMQQLSTLYRQFADVITQKDMVNIFRQDVEAKNKATGENKATRFPIPNIKGGKRQLNIAPATEAQREYNDYLIARMEAFNQLKTKEERTAYAKIDNPLWVLTDAKKASLDVRLVDPTAQRDPTGKVARAAERIKSIYDQWQDDKGTQLVFSDMGTPAKYAVATVESDLKNLAETVLGKGKAAAFISSRLEIYEGEMPYSQTLKELVDKVNAQAETGEMDADQYEKLEEQIRELTASTMTADTGFSVYDDLKASLMEKGIPDDEIAFIHDYNTTLKKEALFDRVRRGEVRVLIGSSMKMGAGTNVQNRLVALHHMDAPWRPSDMEQREGRIVRQGNEFYQRAANAGKPEDFEVELIAYTTQGSSDPVMWQILERKAGAIEQFRNGELDEFVENSNSDADSYAEFKAASTGNPIYRLKLESDAKLLDLDSSYTAQASSIGAAKRFVERFDDEKAAIELRLETLRKADITEFDAEAFTELYRDAQADYLAADNEYDAAMAIYSELDAKTRKERGLKKPQKPKRPMIHELDDEYSIELNKAIIQPAIAAVEQSRRWQGEIKLGKQLGLVMDVDYFTHEGTKTPLIDVRLVDGKGKTIDYMARGMQSSSIVQSPKLMNALHLNAIATALNGEQERFERKLQSLQSTLKDSRQIAKMDITALKQELDEAKSRNLWLSVEASMADIKEELRRSETPNKFVDRETLRKVKRSTFDPNSIRPETVEHNGQRYQTVGVRIPYPGWQYDSVMPALDANGDYVHLLLSHNSKVGEAPVLSEVIPQPTQTPKAEYAFLAEAKARHEARQVEEAKREIGSPVDEPSGDSSTIMFSRSTVAGGVKGDAVSETRINRGLVELWAANVMRDNPVISAAGKIVRVVSSESELPDAVKQEIDKDKSHNTIKGVLYGKQVYIVADKHNDQGSIEQVLLHELAGHYGLRKLFGDNIKAELADIRTRLGGKSGVLKLAKKFNVNLAHYATDYDSRMKSGELTPEQVDDLLFDELLAHVSEMPRMAKPLERMWQKIRQYLHKLGFTATAGYTSADLLDLIQAIRNNLIENPDPDGTGPSPKRKSKPNESREDAAEILFSRTAKAQGMSADEALAQKQNALVSKIKQALYGAPVIGQSLDALGRNKYAMLTLRQMGEVSTVIDKPLGKMIDAYQDEINSMVVTQNMLAEEAAKMAEDLSDWAKANQKEADELFAFAHEATLADVDPSEAFQSREEDLKESIAKQERILKEEGGLNSERGSKAWKTQSESF
ncbi:helicase [Vibrio cholerae]|uniref:Eco57I restriction-modification methylase domain-containing protein n=1 Tax=Vibrio cholerae TaxID=666 RepID=UPI00208A92DE|nr:helicase [Vibrio cholerae]